jgi:hypothetical protein
MDCSKACSQPLSGKCPVTQLSLGPTSLLKRSSVVLNSVKRRSLELFISLFLVELEGSFAGSFHIHKTSSKPNFKLPRPVSLESTNL